MASDGLDGAAIRREIESLKAAKADLESRISALEAQLHGMNHGTEAVPSNGSCPVTSAVDVGLKHGLSPDMIYRYSRHLLLPSFGVQGQWNKNWNLRIFSVLKKKLNFQTKFDEKLYFVFSAAQSNLLKSSVLVVGAGGLGSPALLYLAACGVGTFHLASFQCFKELHHWGLYFLNSLLIYFCKSIQVDWVLWTMMWLSSIICTGR